MAPDGGDLIRRAQRGDRAAFGELVKQHQRRVYATAFKITRNHSDADDVVQESFLRAYRGLGSYDGRAELGTWLHRIVVNTAINHLRKREREPRPGESVPEVTASSQPDPGRAAEDRQALAAALEAVAELSPTLRETFLLGVVEGLPYREISALLEVPEGTVAWRINEARRKVAERLAPYLSDNRKGNADEVLRRTREALGAP